MILEFRIDGVMLFTLLVIKLKKPLSSMRMAPCYSCYRAYKTILIRLLQGVRE
jgi:hypothetical protein